MQDFELTARLAVLLGLAIQFSKSELLTSSASEPLLRCRFAIRFSYLHSVSPLSNFFFLNRYSAFFFFSPPSFPFRVRLVRGRQSLHRLPEVRQGFVSAFFVAGADSSAFGALLQEQLFVFFSAFCNFFFNRLFAAFPALTSLRRTTRRTALLPARQSHPPKSVRRGGAPYT